MAYTRGRSQTSLFETIAEDEVWTASSHRWLFGCMHAAELCSDSVSCRNTCFPHAVFAQGDEEDAADDDGAASKPRRPQAAAASASASASSSHTDSDSDAFDDSDSDDNDNESDSGGNHGIGSRAKRASIKEQLAALEAKANRSSDGIGPVQSAVPAAASAFIPAAQRKASLSAFALAAQNQSDRSATDPTTLSASASDAAPVTDLSGDSAASAAAAAAATTPLALSETERQIRRLRQTSSDGAAALVPSVAAAAPQAALPRHLLRRGSIQVCGSVGGPTLGRGRVFWHRAASGTRVYLDSPLTIEFV
jgi:hypothetical protein